MMYGFGEHGWGMGLAWILGLIILVVVILIIAKVLNQDNTRSSDRKTALDILKERYARGEIDKAEFEEKKKDIL